jgi:two-component system sensor histidine kinase BarA
VRLLQLSLAAKYRVLFGLAVLLIIAAALSVPWMLMSSLVYEQPYREARRICENYFRHLLPRSDEVVGVHFGDASLLPERFRSRVAPRFFRNPANPPGVSGMADAPPFVQDALRKFIRHPKLPDHAERGWDEGARTFRYVHAVRATPSCLRCHEHGKAATPYREGQLAGAIAVSLPDELSDQLVTYYRLWLLGAGALASILAILVFYVISRQFILSPIHELRAVAARVADGDLDVRSRTRTGDEFEQLSESLNAMLERLRASQQELRHANKLLDQKLGEMAETNVALYEANRLKSEFLANVTHELRTPLTSIIGFAELLREGNQLDADARAARFAENILISGRILLEIIDDLLDLAKIEANRVKVELEPVDLAGLCMTLMDFMRPLADKKNLTLDCRLAPHLPVITTDRGRLRQILFNLLSNAVKFTPPEGRVELDARAENDAHVRLAVHDTGPGIRPEDQRLIFEKFRQVDQSETREHHGTGLGLAIARELAQLLGGEVGVQSEVGQGSTFWVRLPLSIREPRPRALPRLT